MWGAHQYCCTLNVLLGESKSEKVCVRNIAVEHKVVEQSVLLTLVLVPHIDVTKLQARTWNIKLETEKQNKIKA